MSQLTGRGLSIRADRLADAIETQARFATLLRTYSQAFFVQTAQNAACNGLHSVSMRGARWLLEEYRVSLFAQQLGTAEPVSLQRIQKALRE